MCGLCSMAEARRRLRYVVDGNYNVHNSSHLEVAAPNQVFKKSSQEARWLRPSLTLGPSLLYFAGYVTIRTRATDSCYL